MIARWWSELQAKRARRRVEAWRAQQDAVYRAARADQRARFLVWLAERELPGTPRTIQPGGEGGDER